MVRARNWTALAFFATSIFAGLPGDAQGAPELDFVHRSELPDGIWLRSAIMTARGGFEGGIDMKAPMPEALDVNELGYFIVHTQKDGAQLRDWLLLSGAEVLHYLPHNAWLIRASGAVGASVAARGQAVGVDLFMPYHPTLKIAPELDVISSDDEMVRVVAHLMPGTDGDAVKALLAKNGLEVAGGRDGQSPRVAWQMPEGRRVEVLRQMAQLPEVFWLERRGELRLLNAEAVPLLQSGENDGTTPIHDEGLKGEDQIVAFIDTGMDHDSCFFRDDSGEEVVVNSAQTLSTDVNDNHRKVHAYDFLWTSDEASNNRAYDNHGHGTHVSGNIGGAAESGSAQAENGMAPAVRFVVQDGGFNGVDNCADMPGLGCPVVDLLPFFNQAYDQGARIHTNSWGDNENSPTQWTYSAGSQDVDAFSNAHPDFLLIFAAGNSGPRNGTVGSPSTAKNALAVGGSANGDGLESVVSFSSRGPTADGRFKPDVMAPASNTAAGSDGDVTSDNCSLNSGSGTSYAAPLVAGAAALVRQYFMEGYYPSGRPTATDRMTPSSALMRAMLINSGRNMTSTDYMPSYDQGWGRVALVDNLLFRDGASQLKVVDGEKTFSSTSDDPYRLTLDVTDSNVPLKVTLVWNDPASTPAAEMNLVNDLDLTLRSGRRIWRGNHFRRGQSIPGGEADNLNPSEQILLPAPKAGRYVLEVSASNLPVGTQDFALVVRGAFE